MNIRGKLEQFERRFVEVEHRTRKTVIRVAWPDGRETGPEAGPGDHVIILRVVYERTAKDAEPDYPSAT